MHSQTAWSKSVAFHETLVISNIFQMFSPVGQDFFNSDADGLKRARFNAWGAECSPFSRGTFKFRPKMSGKMSMASRLGCPAERRLLSEALHWRVVTVHTYRAYRYVPQYDTNTYKSYHDHSEDEPGNYSGIGILLRKWQKLQLYYWLTNPQVASVGVISWLEAFQLKRHPTYKVGKRDCLSLAQEKILSNQIDYWHSTKTAQY